MCEQFAQGSNAYKQPGSQALMKPTGSDGWDPVRNQDVAKQTSTTKCVL